MKNNPSFGSSQDFIEKELKPNILWALLLNTLNALFLVLLLIIIFKIPAIITGEDVLKILIEGLNLSGLMSLDYAKISYGLKGILVFGAALYVLTEMMSIGDKKILFEDNKIVYSSGGFAKNKKIKRYSDIVKVRYEPHLFNVGKIILDTYDVTKPIMIDYVRPLNKNFEDLKEIITRNMTAEVSNKLKKATNGEIEETSVNNIIELLKKESVNKDDVVHTLVNVSENQAGPEKKDIFKTVLLELVRTRRISRDTLNEVIKELKEKGLLSMEDIGDIVDLKFETEEKYMGI